MNRLHPMDALDIQLGLIRYYRSDQGRAFINRLQDLPRRQPGLAIEGKPDIAQRLAENLNQAQTYVVYPHIVTELWRRAADLAFQPLLPQDLPEPRGFVLLGQNLYIQDREGKRCAIKAFMWSNDYDEVATEHGSGARGVLVTNFSDLHDRTDEYNRQWRDDDLRLQPGQNLVNTHPWVYGHTPLDLSYPDEELEDSILDSWRFLNFCQQLWAFVQDQIPRTAFPYRQLRHRLLRAGSSLQDVKVVDLRAIESTGPNPDAIHQSVLWTHQWRVRKHLRRQWYPSLGIHKVIAIEPYVKGPEYLPLVDKDVVVRVKR